MRHLKKKITLDRKKGPRKSLMRNLATSLVLHEKIKTTEAKAKAVRSVVERLVTISKKAGSGASNLTARRKLLAYLTQARAAKKMIEVIGPKYLSRSGGYLRINKIGLRHSDGAKMVEIEFV